MQLFICSDTTKTMLNNAFDATEWKCSLSLFALNFFALYLIVHNLTPYEIAIHIDWMLKSFIELDRIFLFFIANNQQQ